MVMYIKLSTVVMTRNIIVITSYVRAFVRTYVYVRIRIRTYVRTLLF